MTADAEVTFTCRGHPAIRASHHKTLELTRDVDITERASCVVGVGGDWDDRALRSLGGRVEVELRVGDDVATFEADVSGAAVDHRALVFRRGPELAEKTFGFFSTSSAADLPRPLVAALQSPDAQLHVTLRTVADAGDRGGVLYVVGLPIGNFDDLSPRARRTLEAVDVVLAEDTRRFRSFARDTGLTYRRLHSHHANNEAAKVDDVVALLDQGLSVAIVSDAGTPVVNDPGFPLVRAAADAGHVVRPVPGPSAPIVALSAAAVPAASFLFDGYLPRRPAERRTRLAALGRVEAAIVVFETPHRLMDALADVASALPGRPLCIARELTKIHEEIVRTSTDDAVAELDGVEPRGEYTLVIGPPPDAASGAGGADEGSAADVLDPAVRRLVDALAGKVPTRALADAIAEATTLSRSDAYDLVLRAAKPRP